MLKKAGAILLCLLVAGAIWAWFNGGSDLYELQQATSPATVPEDYALQDDSQVAIPPREPHKLQNYNELKNLYWGDLHVHTVESFDAVLFGTTLGIEDAYRFARGDALRNDGGELMSLSRPLDFVAITDHAEGFGLRTRCGDTDLSMMEDLNCWLMQTPNVITFLALAAAASTADEQPSTPTPPGTYRNRLRQAPTLADISICNLNDEDPDRCYRDAEADWKKYQGLADDFNQPGILTTFSAYEYSPPLPASGKHHRNVIFNGTELPRHALSYFDVSNAIDLWDGLEKQCTGDCDFLTIPHNMNKGWGLFYSPFTWDGQAYDRRGWELRQRREPLAEIYQIKGSSECALGVGATDEECGFSQVLPPCTPGQESGCAFTTSFTRQGLKTGLQLQEKLGFNPLAFGHIAATDTHNANPGDAEEWDFVGKVAATTSPATRRMREWPGREPYQSNLEFHTSGGLTAVWAEENTRDALFSSMQRKEVYATSGPRITLRFFAGWGLDATMLERPNAIALATASGQPMGATLNPADAGVASPVFLVWAGADLMSAPLQRIQMVKGWLDGEGNTHETVMDIACSDGLTVDPIANRCPNNGASVDITTCTIQGGSGATDLAVTWQDANYDASQHAFYYVRALQNPTCRWSTYDALRLGVAPPTSVPATIRERAWSSPIWIKAAESNKP